MAGVTAPEVRVEVDRPIERWRPFVQPLLFIPHGVVNGLLSVLSAPVTVVMGVAVLATGRVPEGLARFQVMVLRGRVRAYSYLFLLRRSFPPFALEPVTRDPGDDPVVTVSIAPPVAAERWALLRSLRVLPQVLVLLPVGAVLDLGLPVLAVVCAVGRGWSPSMERFLITLERWVLAIVMYVTLVSNDPPRWGFAAYREAPA